LKISYSENDAYEPDSADNSAGFTTEIGEEKAVDSIMAEVAVPPDEPAKPDDAEEKATEMGKLLIIGAGALFVIVVAFICYCCFCGKKEEKEFSGIPKPGAQQRT